MFEETFADGSSFVHRLDPRVKTAAAFAFSLLAAVADRPAALAVAMMLSVGLILLAKLPARAVAYRLAVVNAFVLFLWLTLPLTYPGTPVFHLGRLAVSREGLAQALLITLKSNAIILAGIALLSTTHLATMGRALGRLRVPDKLIHILLFMLRYLGVIGQEYMRLQTSMKVRCFEPHTNLRTYQTYANMVGMLLLSSYEKAEAIHAAMLCRGFSGKFFAVDDFEMRDGDILFGAAVAVSLLLMGILQWAPLAA